MTTVSLRDEAKALLQATRLEAILERFGNPKIGGSYSYDLLVDRDIDIDIRMPRDVDLSYDLRAEFAATLLRSVQQMRGIKMADVYHFPNGAKHAIDGIWFGLDVLSDISGERWNIDIWLLPNNGKTEEDNDLTKRLHALTAEERRAILTIKSEALARGVKEKGVTSVQVYHGVLYHGVSTFNDFLEYLDKVENSNQ